MARRAHAPKTPKRKQARIELADYQYPKEKSTYLQAYGGMSIVFLWIAAMGFFFVKKADSVTHYWQWVYVAVYPIAAVLFVNFISTRARRAQIKAVGARGKVMGNNYPELYKLLTDSSRMLGMENCPDMYLLEDKLPYLYGLPGGKGTILLSSAMRSALSDSEVAALIAHELGHIQAGHLQMELAINWLRSANVLWKVALLPVTILSMLLRGWLDLIDFTADRAAVIVTGKPALLNAALLKVSIALDPQAELTREEVDEYLQSAGDVQTDSKQMARYFRVGQFIARQPSLKERVEQIQNFLSSDQAKKVAEKLREIRGAQPMAGQGGEGQ